MSMSTKQKGEWATGKKLKPTTIMWNDNPTAGKSKKCAEKVWEGLMNRSRIMVRFIMFTHSRRERKVITS